MTTGFSVLRARKAQLNIAARVVHIDFFQYPIQLIGGVDVAYRNNRAIGAWVVLERGSWRLVNYAVGVVKVKFPYVPTLLSFREVYPCIVAWKKLRVKPSISLVDGQGVLHPYRAGFASHLGVVLDVPTIGVAKKLLCGTAGEWRGDTAPITDQGTVIGCALKTRGRPIYISTGHRVSLKSAVDIVRKCVTKYRLPEPIRIAHAKAKEAAKKYLNHTDSCF